MAVNKAIFFGVFVFLVAGALAKTLSNKDNGNFCIIFQTVLEHVKWHYHNQFNGIDCESFDALNDIWLSYNSLYI